MALLIKMTSIIGVITDLEGKILLAKKGHTPGHKLSVRWHFPGGTKLHCETPEDCIMREMYEETGLYVNPKLLSQQDKASRCHRFFYYLCKPTGGHLRAGGDVVEVNWFTKQQTEKILGYDLIRQYPRRVQELVIPSLVFQ